MTSLLSSGTIFAGRYDYIHDLPIGWQITIVGGQSLLLLIAVVGLLRFDSTEYNLGSRWTQIAPKWLVRRRAKRIMSNIKEEFERMSPHEQKKFRHQVDEAETALRENRMGYEFKVTQVMLRINKRKSYLSRRAERDKAKQASEVKARDPHSRLTTNQKKARKNFRKTR